MVGGSCMAQQLDILDGEYALILDHSGADGLVGHIDHVNRNGQHGFGCVSTPVAHLAAHIHPGAPELFRSHWSIALFFRSDVRYEQAHHTTTVVASPERQAGKNRALLQRLVTLRDSSLPFYHPDLPQEVGRALIDAKFCHEPASVAVHHYDSGPFVHFGQIYDDV
jgi:hypothetical protein